MSRSAFAVLLFTACTAIACKGPDLVEKSRIGVLKWVDTRIGTDGHGHTFMGVAVPFGAVQLGPSNFNKGWDWCSGYHASDSICIGFAHLHLNGTGCSDTGDLLFMPTTGKPQVRPGSQETPGSGYASRYTHEREVTTPAYYRLHLDDYGIDVELTATERVGFHRYTFPATKQNRQVIINLFDANGDDRATETYIEQKDERTIRGYRCSTGWSKRQQVYFSAHFSVPVQLEIYKDDLPVGDSRSEQGINIKGIVHLPDNLHSASVKVGISPVGMDGADRNIEEELPGWNFDATVSSTARKWNHELSKISVESHDSTARRIFYTGLYHAFLQPILFNDCDGTYRGADGRVHKNPGHETYTVFSLWDTYRAAHPLYTLLQAGRVPDMINTMLDIYDQQGLLPVWHLYGSDTREMIGIQSVPVIADALIKGFPGIDSHRALKAMAASMSSDYKGLGWLRKQDYIPADKEGESVAKGLEYALADGCIALAARKAGDEALAREFGHRAQFYRNYWDPETRFFRGRNADGSFREPFDPFRSTHRNDDYCEGTGWQYVWLVPHDVQGLVSLFGSDESFITKLDSLFTVEGDMGAQASGDISGLIGQYAHGNEPGHHTVYLYAYVGQQWKTARLVRRILNEMYSDQPDGLTGNEDCGQMSSWYVFSAMGFYPVHPALGIYVLGSPAFDRVSFRTAGNNLFTVIAENNSKKNIYIQSAELNGKAYPYAYIRHTDLIRGGTLRLKMGPEPSDFGTDPHHRPVEE